LPQRRRKTDGGNSVRAPEKEAIVQSPYFFPGSLQKFREKYRRCFSCARLLYIYMQCGSRSGIRDPVLFYPRIRDPDSGTGTWDEKYQEPESGIGDPDSSCILFLRT
jgi:hypothetical protein